MNKVYGIEWWENLISSELIDKYKSRLVGYKRLVSGFKNIDEYKEYQNFKLNDATYNERYKKVEALYEALKLKFEQKQNLFKEKNFELTPKIGRASCRERVSSPV